MLRERYIPADIREDIKLGKVVSLKSIIYFFIALIICLLLSFAIEYWLLKLIFTFGIPIIVMLVVNYDAPGAIKKLVLFKTHCSMIKSLNDLCTISSFDDVIQTKDSEIVFLETSVPPWEVCPDSKKEYRANNFSYNVFSLLGMGAEMSVFGICSAEDTTQLEERLKALDSLNRGVKDLENERIEHHYNLSKSAKSVKYLIRLKANAIKDALEIFDENEVTVIGGDLVEEYAKSHLIPGLKKVRGKEDDIKITRDHLIIDGMYVKTFLLSVPCQGIPCMIYGITHGKHARKPGVNVNFSMHFKKAEVKFDFLTSMKLNRLQKNIEAYDTGRASDEPRREEIKTLEALQHFRDVSGSSTSDAALYADIWFTVTISSMNFEDFNTSLRAFKDYITAPGLGFSVDELLFEQSRALDMAWIAGGNSFFDVKNGRVMDMDALSALYPFVDGTITDYKGCYIAHRIADVTAVYKDFAEGTDNQNIIVTGASDEGKSTCIKGITSSLNIQGFKGYIFDVDGEYRSLCKKLGGTWVDYTTGTGKYVDPTIIESPIIDEVDPESLDEDTREKLYEADNARYQEAITNTRAIVSLLCSDFSKAMENALEFALIKMWESEGIHEDDPSSWIKSRNGSCSLHKLYNLIKNFSEDAGHTNHDGAKALHTELWSYFEGAKKNMFRYAETADWIRNSKLTVFHVASSADNDVDQQMGAVKIVMITHLVWQQIKRDRIKKQHFSFEVYDELQRLIRNKHAWPAIYRSITTGRKFNDQVIMGFNDPSILFEGEGGKGIWDNTKYKIFFSTSAKTINTLAKYADMPDEVNEKWLNLSNYKYSFIFNQNKAYDILRMALPQSEISKLHKTRGLS
ncbi:TraG/VirB4 family ATPase [Acetivibrio cellulolyticus]|uniref:TraG/VirB4 family ATPase n=1 Tax=Acetivibrio cellulolyticus TaxID=35830 RepID=UPI0001E2F5DC|nr:hypothetical protein [Acetivibrio cellulolyticus]